MLQHILRLSITTILLVNKPSSRYLEDASYVKLRSLRIGYNFPASLAEKIWVKNASIYIMGENLFTITKFSGVDPEVGAYGSRDITLDNFYWWKLFRKC